MAPSPITLWQTEGEKVEAGADFIFLGPKTTEDSDCSDEITTAFDCVDHNKLEYS